MSRQSLISINTRETSDTKQMELGTKYEDEFGRIYRYTGAAGTDLDHGKLVVAPTGDGNVVDVNVAASESVGATSLTIDAAGTIVADAYVDGSIAVSDATGEGYTYRVTGNTAVTGAGEVTVYLAEPLIEAVTVDASQVTLLKSPWQDVVISPTDQADQPVGIPNVDIAADEFGWVQTRGVCSAWADEAFAAGAALTTGSVTAGQVEALDAAGEFQIGVAMFAAQAAGEYPQIFLTID